MTIISLTCRIFQGCGKTQMQMNGLLLCLCVCVCNVSVHLCHLAPIGCLVLRICVSMQFYNDVDDLENVAEAFDVTGDAEF